MERNDLDEGDDDIRTSFLLSFSHEDKRKLLVDDSDGVKVATEFLGTENKARRATVDPTR